MTDSRRFSISSECGDTTAFIHRAAARKSAMKTLGLGVQSRGLETTACCSVQRIRFDCTGLIVPIGYLLVALTTRSVQDCAMRVARRSLLCCLFECSVRCLAIDANGIASHLNGA